MYQLQAPDALHLVYGGRKEWIQTTHYIWNVKKKTKQLCEIWDYHGCERCHCWSSELWRCVELLVDTSFGETQFSTVSVSKAEEGDMALELGRPPLIQL
jgi:hypothetical protein